jgi:hypothetical protein
MKAHIRRIMLAAIIISCGQAMAILCHRAFFSGRRRHRHCRQDQCQKEKGEKEAAENKT